LCSAKARNEPLSASVAHGLPNDFRTTLRKPSDEELSTALKAVGAILIPVGNLVEWSTSTPMRPSPPYVATAFFPTQFWSRRVRCRDLFRCRFPDVAVG
jgi:hypothetical protein